MIQGRNGVAGYYKTADLNGNKIEGEKRQCAHCQFSWQYRPGSGIKRGFCKRCNGLLCGKDVCMKYCIPYMSKIEAVERGQKLDDLLKLADHRILGQTSTITQ